jgi:hypothetical protein
MSAGNGKISDNATGSNRSYSLNNPLWKRLRTCRKTHCMMIMIIIIDYHDNDNGGVDDEDDDDDEDHDNDNDGDKYKYST